MKESKAHIALLLENICHNDDQNSFEQLLKLFYHRLINFCIHNIGDKEAAEEIVSDVFIKLWINRKENSDIRNIETYLFIAVKNQSLNHLKHFSKYRVVYLEEEGKNQLINTHDPRKELERKELIYKMNEAIDTLPRQCKLIFSMIREDGLKYKEVAEILNLSPRTVETQLVRAMKKLDQILSPYLEVSKAPSKRKSKSIHAVKSFLFSLFF